MDELKPGDKVMMTDKYYEGEEHAGKIWTVCSEPWIVCGEAVVLLEGYKGAYAVDGLRKVKRYYGNDGSTLLLERSTENVQIIRRLQRLPIKKFCLWIR